MRNSETGTASHKWVSPTSRGKSKKAGNRRMQLRKCEDENVRMLSSQHVAAHPYPINMCEIC